MSEQEKALVEKIAKLPPELQNRFSDKVDGAAMALEALKAEREKETA